MTDAARDNAILAMHDQRRSTGWIASHFGMAPKSIYNIVSRMKKARGDRPKPWTDADRPIRIAIEDDKRFAEAMARMRRSYADENMTELLKRVRA